MNLKYTQKMETYGFKTKYLNKPINMERAKGKTSALKTKLKHS